MDEPSQQEFELSVFGRGFGEALAIHIGNGDWLVVDSCLDDNSKPCILSYFDEIGVDARKITHVIATHWDTDHIKGLSNICNKAENSYFVFSQAMQSADFLKLIFGLKDIAGTTKTSTEEFNGILEVLAQRYPHTSGSERLILASDYKTILADKIDINGKTVKRSITALSPSTAAQLKSLQSISDLIPGDLEPLRNVRELKPNHTSIVLLLEIGDLCLLLGSDLEELGVSEDGWSAIVNGRVKLRTGIEVFKIPHHGSSNGHNDKIWADHISNDNISVVTPFHHGKTNIPTFEDLKRISDNSGRTFISGASKEKKVKIQDRTKKNILRKIGKAPYSVERKIGRVTLRKSLISASEWKVITSGACADVKDILEQSS